MRMILALGVALVLALPGASCRRSPEATGKVTVAASFFPLAEVAREVSGSRADVRNVTPVGAEPHDFELSPSQVDEVLDAELVVYLGGGFQPAVERLAGRADGVTIDALAGLPVREGDPHVWLDPTLMQRITARVAEGLGRVDPGGASSYDRAAAHASERLGALDARYRAGLRSCATRVLVVSHAAYGYLADRYGLRQVSVASGTDPQGEPSPTRIAAVADLVREQHVPTVYGEPLGSSQVMDTVARESGARVAVLDPLEGLTAGAAPGSTYLSIMESNLEALRTGLSCR